MSVHVEDDLLEAGDREEPADLPGKVRAMLFACGDSAEPAEDSARLVLWTIKRELDLLLDRASCRASDQG